MATAAISTKRRTPSASGVAVVCGAIVALAFLAPSMAADPSGIQPASGVPQDGLIAHWPLAGNAQDRSGNGRDALVRGTIDFSAAGPNDRPSTAAVFNGRDGYLEVPAKNAPPIGKGDFSLTAWVHLDEKLDDVPGDLVSRLRSDQPARISSHAQEQCRRGQHPGQPSPTTVRYRQPPRKCLVRPRPPRQRHPGLRAGDVRRQSLCRHVRAGRERVGPRVPARRRTALGSIAARRRRATR